LQNDTPAGDAELLRRAGAGDKLAFERLLGRHGDAIFRFAARTCGSGREAEDAVQDGLLSAWKGAATFRGESSARTWLFQVVVHACRRRHRRRVGEPDRHAGVEEAEAVASAERGADERLADRQVGAAMELALAGLGEEACEVLVLRDVEGLSGEETAAALGLSLAAMKSRLHRARLELKERVEAILGRPVREVAP
jgi:RNA polymerase sigma-70 factor (ECF subfamily)